ncbi:phage holin family protein [Trueperella pyogenes]|uniref:phage holin family protein n=1 Tax=Trueperella pyogenes TaxID=1661 RepID=UPI000660B1D6|nr:phage holin family protein [Trueperella pyogenes]
MNKLVEALEFTVDQGTSLTIVFIALMVTDYITGTMAAWSQHSLSSKSGRIGIFKKITICLIIALMKLIDWLIAGNSGLLFTSVVLFYCTNEAISILENCQCLKVALPDHWLETLRSLFSSHQS